MESTKDHNQQLRILTQTDASVNLTLVELMVYAQTAHKDILFLTKIVLLVLYMLNMILIVIDVYARTVCLWLMEYVEVHVLMLMRYFRYS